MMQQKISLQVEALEIAMNLVLDGKLAAIKSAQSIIADPLTSDAQLVAELTYSIHQFEEILPIFKNKVNNDFLATF